MREDEPGVWKSRGEVEAGHAMKGLEEWHLTFRQ